MGVDCHLYIDADIQASDISEVMGLLMGAKGELTTMRGGGLSLKVYPTDTNFILLKLLHFAEDEIFKRLIQRGLLIRKASSFEGLDDTYIRVAIKDQQSNKKLIHAMKEVLP